MVRGWLLLLGLLGLVACRETPAPTGAGVRLVYWPPPNRFDIEMSRKLVASWNAEHPEIVVELQPLPAGRSSEEVLLAAIVGGTTPDICSNILSGTVGRMVRAGALVPLSKRFEDFESYLRARSPEGAVEPLRSSDGHFYQLPWKANPLMLILNQGLLEKHDLSPPRSYSELLALAARLTRDTDGDGRVDQWALGLQIDNTWWKRFDDLYPFYIAASRGRTLVRGREVLFDGPEMVQAFELLRTVFARGYAPRSYFASELFLRGRIAIVTGSAPSIPDLEAKKPPGFRYRFAPVPVPDGHTGAQLPGTALTAIPPGGVNPPGPPVHTFGDLKSMVIFSSCRHPEAAWRFLKYLTSARADHLLLTEASQIPLRRALFATEPFASALASRPDLAELARRVEHIRGTDDTPDLVEIFDTLSQAYEAGAIHGVIPPAQAVKQAARRVRKILER